MPYTFGAFQLPGAIQSRALPVAARRRSAEAAGLDGEWSQGGLVAPKRIIVTGKVRCSSVAARNAAWDALVSGLPLDAPGNLVLEQADRRYPAEVEAISDVVDAMRPWSLEYEVQFVVPGGCAEAAAVTNASLTTTGGTLAAPAGNHHALPRIEVTVSSIGTGGTLTVTNTSTGQSVTAKPGGTGVIAFDSAEERLYRAGADWTGEWTAGEWPRLLPGVANFFSVTTTGGLTVSAVQVLYRARWR